MDLRMFVMLPSCSFGSAWSCAGSTASSTLWLKGQHLFREYFAQAGPHWIFESILRSRLCQSWHATCGSLET